ncbi:M14 family metallopeptidase [Bacteroidota bacterium]
MKFLKIITIVTFVFCLSNFAFSQTENKFINPDSIDLSNLFKHGYILQDRNNDSIIDYINYRIILPEKPSEAEVVSAANVSARFGYETSSLDFDNNIYDSDEADSYDLPVIIIGSKNKMLAKLSESNDITGKGLRPGQGEILFFSPNSFFKKGATIISGYDATGLISAANYLSAYYPDIWKLNGKKYTDINKQINKYLEDRDIKQKKLFFKRIVIDSNIAGVKKLCVDIKLPHRVNFDSTLLAFTNIKTDSVSKKLSKLSSLEFNSLHRMELNLTCPDTCTTIDLLPKKEWKTKFATTVTKTASPDFSLSNLFSIKGLFADDNKDLIADNTIAYFSVNGTGFSNGLNNLALRTGLETAGMRLPLVSIAGEENFPEKNGFPVLIGIDHYNINFLKKENRLHGISSKPGTGFIQFVPEAFNKKNAIIVGGSDSEGLNAIAEYTAGRIPYLWDYGKGNYKLEDIEEDVRKFFQVKNSAGQAASAFYKLSTWLGRISAKKIESISVDLALKETPEGLISFTRKIIKDSLPEANVSVNSIKTGYGSGKIIIDEKFDIPWEVEKFWELFSNNVKPELIPGSKGKIFVRLSESPEIRNIIKKQIIKEIESAGADPDDFEIVILCAYKQGYSWLNDYILPKIKNTDVDSIIIRYHSLKDSEEVKWQTVNANTRWLQEIFPIDTIMARELNKSASYIRFESSEVMDPIYSVIVKNKSGEVILEESFDPKYVIRPFFDLFPEYESVRVTTGWVNVKINGKKILDKRIATDPELFWDRLQQKTFRKIIDYVMDIQDGKPSSANAPYFDEFIVDLTLSEPNYRIGIDEEVISSTEALHEDILFHTLAMFNRIGGRYGAGNLSYPGRILPMIRKTVDGKPGNAKILFTGKEKAFPELILTYKESGKEAVKQRYPLNSLNISTPLLRGIEVNSSENGVKKLLFDVEVTDSVDRYEEYKLRGNENTIDRAFISAPRYVEMISILKRMHNNGIYKKKLSYDLVEEMMFRFYLRDSLKFTRLASLKRSTSPSIAKNPDLPDVRYKYKGEQIIQWDTPMSPSEVVENMANLNTFSEVNVYHMVKSFLGHDVFAADIYLPVEGKYISQAKLNVYKPSLMLIGRVHGNEVSSTSHQLRLAELCATDSLYKGFLKNVNLVIYPVVNPDGAQIAYEMQKENPDFMLHAGRYGALGTDVGSRSFNGDNLYPESGIASKIKNAWVPDIYMDMHGVPSHEWVQLFAGYSAWVNSRNGGARNYWLPRGWYFPGFSWIDDKKQPEFMTAQKAITDSITAGVMSVPEVQKMNKRIYSRYIKYGKQDPETYREYFYQGVQMEARLTKSKVPKSGMTTYYSLTTESADETAYGDWLKLVCKAGLANSRALLDYLANGKNRIVHQHKEYSGLVTRSVFRKKPILPKKQVKIQK